MKSSPAAATWATATVSALALILGLALFVFLPVEARPNVESHPAGTYEAAVLRLDAIASRDTGLINPDCRDRRWLHGAQTSRAIVLIHGLTNCPKQYDALGDLLSKTGANVIAVRLPYHGYRDRDTDAMASLTADDLARYTGEAIDVADGLGDQVDVLGISGGGVAAVWAGQFRPDAARVVSIAPVFAPGSVPEWLVEPAMHMMLRIPNFQTVIADAYPYAYTGMSIRGTAQTMLLGQTVLHAAAATRPAARSIAVITNDGDDAVNNAVTAALVARWRGQGTDVRTAVLPISAGLAHDTIDPTSGRHPEAVVYPLIFKMLDLPSTAR